MNAEQGSYDDVAAAVENDCWDLGVSVTVPHAGGPDLPGHAVLIVRRPGHTELMVSWPAMPGTRHMAQSVVVSMIREHFSKATSDE